MTGNDTSAIRELLSRYETALNESDIEAAVAVYAEDGVFYPYQLPTAAGTAELRASYAQIFATIRLAVAFEVREVVVEGDLAFATTSSRGTVTVLEPDVTVEEANREVFVLVRGADGWRVARYMFNKAEAA